MQDKSPNKTMPSRAAFLLLATLLAGCNAGVFTQGIAVEEAALEEITPGTARDEVLRRLGPPSITALDGGRAWFYISWQTRRREPLSPVELSRNIIVVHFDDENHVTHMDRYGEQDGKDIAYAGQTTPAPGSDPGWLSLILGNIGRVIPAGIPSE